jgi:tripartite-type tricarboxylate transporter receptor subunit TctC
LLLRAPHVVTVNKSFSADTLSGLIAYARANPGKLIYATLGIETQNHIASELLAQLADIKITQVPYRGGGLALNDLLAGTVDILVKTSNLSSGNFRATLSRDSPL